MSSGKDPFYVYINGLHPGVTGSCILVTVAYPNGRKTNFFVDCGLFQEREFNRYNEVLDFNPKNFDFGLVTHNHVDHIGRLPLLVKNGFEGKIYTSYVTKQLMPLALADTVNILQGGNGRNERRHSLYVGADVSQTLQQVQSCQYNEKIQIDDNIEVTFLENAHLIGAAMILVRIHYHGYNDINLLFTGDYNNKNMFLNVRKVPKNIRKLPITVIQESTYGDMDSTQITKCFEQNVQKQIEKGGIVLAPVFSLGRAQEILYILKRMQNQGKLSVDIPIYFDGKLAHSYTEKYMNADLNLKEGMKDFLPRNLGYVSKESRMGIIEDTNPKIIVTTSGMGSYGPAQTYIPLMISKENVLIHFTGYTTVGTLGRKLKDASFGDTVEVGGRVLYKRAQVEYTSEFSAHAKADEIIEFLKQFEKLNLVLVNHGEEDVKDVFAGRVKREVDAKEVGILGRSYYFKINPYGLITTKPSKFM